MFNKNEIIDQIGIDILLEQGEWCDMKTQSNQKIR